MTRRGMLMTFVLAGWALAAACTQGGGSAGSTAGATGSDAAPMPGVPVYTSYNLWYEKPDHMYSTGFHVGRMIPAGTQVTNVRIQRGYILFNTAPDGMSYKMEFVQKHHPGASINQFTARLFTPRSLGELTEGFNENEMTAVKQGMLRPGMRKNAVLVAYGYPPEILTSSLQSGVWLYQKNRFQKNQVQFGEDGNLSGATMDMM